MITALHSTAFVSKCDFNAAVEGSSIELFACSPHQIQLSREAFLNVSGTELKDFFFFLFLQYFFVNNNTFLKICSSLSESMRNCNTVINWRSLEQLKHVVNVVIFYLQKVWFDLKPIVSGFSIEPPKDDAVVGYFTGDRWPSDARFDVVGEEVNGVMRQPRMLLKILLPRNGLNLIWYLQIILFIRFWF
jgi:hypothetical protein